MNEVKLLNIGGIDQNIKDQYVRDVIAPSENGLDSSTNLPVSSRHYDEGEYLIGQDRQYYIAITDIEIGDTLVVGTNVKATTVSDEIIALKNQSADTVLEVIADVETSATASKGYSVGSYLYWNYGLSAGMYKVISEIDTSDALVVDTNIEAANKIMNIISGIESKLDTIKYSNPNLIDNPWFTVNQRGQSSYSAGVYTVDRWILGAGSLVARSTDSPYIELKTLVTNTNAWMRQKVENDLDITKKITYSAIIESSVTSEYGFSLKMSNRDNTSQSKEKWFPTTANEKVLVSWTEFPYKNTSFEVINNILANASVKIYALKVELGSVSTLVNDAEPNYAEELAKCQRYFHRIKCVGLVPIFSGFAASTLRAQVYMSHPVPMRILPTVTKSNDLKITIRHNNNTENNITSGAVRTYEDDSHYLCLLDFNTLSISTLTANEMLTVSMTSGYIDFSADL